MSSAQSAFTLDQHAPSVFSFGTHEIRIVMRDGEPWFVCTDVASALGYLTAKDAARHLDDDEKGRHIVPTPGGDQSVTIINESGLYALVLRSRKPEARKFAKWVTAEVLPSIRKTGSYGTPRIDARALLLDGQSDRTVTLPDHIQAALNARAGVLAGEAFTLIHEHLRRRVAFRAVNGDDELCRDDVVLNLIAEGDLGDALAHEYVTKVRHLLSYFNEVANVACRSRDQVGDHLKALRTTH